MRQIEQNNRRSARTKQIDQLTKMYFNSDFMGTQSLYQTLHL